MSGTEPKLSELLALDRSWLAAERTLMAWLRTSLSLISFGFTIYKFLQLLQEQSQVEAIRPQAPRNVGLTLIGMGTVALMVACIQHRNYARKLNALHPHRPYRPVGLAMGVASLLALLGLLMFWSIVLHAGPFG